MPSGPPLDFAAEYRRGYPILWTVAAGVLGAPADAEDLVQEAVCLAFARRDQFRPGTNFLAWVAQIVRYLGLNRRRTSARPRVCSLGDAAGTEPAAPSDARGGVLPSLRLGPRGEIPAGQCSFDDEVMGALAGLGETARACLLLRTVQGLSYAEIARVLGVPEGTVMSHVHRSRARLRLALAGKRGDSGPT